MRIATIILLCIVIAPLSSHCQENISPYANLWRGMDDSHKDIFIAGMISGTEAARIAAQSDNFKNTFSDSANYLGDIQNIKKIFDAAYAKGQFQEIPFEVIFSAIIFHQKNYTEVLRSLEELRKNGPKQ